MFVVPFTPEAYKDPRVPSPTGTIDFEVKRRLKLWVLLRDDIYYGSYAEHNGALIAAEREIKAVIESGGKAQMRDVDAPA